MSEAFIRAGLVDEIDRLIRGGPKLGSRPGGLGLSHFIAHCAEPSTVLNRVCEVMLAVCRNSIGAWPPDDQWPTLLPRWFVERCAPQQSREEAEEWLKWWRGLPLQEQERAR